MPRLGRLLAVLLTAAVLALLGWGAVSVLSSLQRSEPANNPIRVTARVEVRTLEKTVTTRGVVGFATGAPLVAGGSGRVTAVWMSVGSVVREGDRLLEIEGRPVVAVNGPKPFWRDLAIGDRGPDVELLQGILAASGYLAFQPDGSFGPATKEALTAWQEDHGFAEADGTFRIDDWLVGSWPRRVGQVMVRRGHFVNPGSVLVVPTASDPSVTIELTPSDRLRVARGDRARVGVAATGSTAQGTVAELTATPKTREDGSVFYPGTIRLRENLDAPEGTDVSVTIVVDRAEEVMTVPLASVVSDAAGEAAVRVARANGSVETVPVELGLSEGAWVEVRSGLSGNERVLVAEEED